MATDLWRVSPKIDTHTPSLLCALAFNIRWECRNADYCVNVDDDFSTSSKNFMNGSSNLRDLLVILQRCMGARRQNAHCSGF